MEAEIQGIQVLEDLIEELEDELAYLQGGMQSNNTVWAIKVARLKRERLKALAAMSKSKLLFADLELFVAENELHKLTDKSNVQRDDKYLRKTSAHRHQRYTPYRRNDTSHITSSNVSPDSTIGGTFYRSSPKETPNNSPDLPPKPNVSPIEMRDHPKHWSSKLRDSSTSNSPKKSSIASSSSSQTNSASDMNKSISTMSHSSVSTTLPHTVTMSNSPVTTSGSNKSLTDSIIAEFNKPYWNINSRSNSNMFSSTSKQSIPPPSVLKKRSHNVKINPVSNIDAYKKANAQKSLSYKSHLLYMPKESGVTPNLHPKDPRGSKISLESKEKPTTQTPISLPVPSMVKNNDVYTPPKKQVPYVPISCTQTQNSHVSAKQVAKGADTRHASATDNHHPRFLSTSTPIKQIKNRHVPYTSPVSQPENRQSMSVPTSLSMLKCHDYNKQNQTQVTPPKRFENQHVFLPNNGSTVEHRPMPVSTPQKWFENKHICVPVPPLYSHGSRPYVVGQNREGEMNSLNTIYSSQNSATKQESRFNKKENRRPNSPKRVCFYHSS